MIGGVEQQGNRRKIFVVDDNPDIGYILNCFLDEEDFQTRVFQNIADFYSVFPHKIPDLFLLDVMLPDGNGIEPCEQLKREAPSSDVPILLMSAHKAAQKLAAQSWADGFISKPFDLNVILENMYRHLN